MLAKSGPIFEKNSLKPSAMSSEFVKSFPLILNSFTFVGLFCLPSKLHVYCFPSLLWILFLTSNSLGVIILFGFFHFYIYFISGLFIH